MDNHADVPRLACVRQQQQSMPSLQSWVAGNMAWTFLVL